LQIVEPAENTLPSKMQKFCTSAPVIWTVVVCAMPGAGIAIIIPDNTTTTTFLSIEALNVLSSGTFPHDGSLNAYLGCCLAPRVGVPDHSQFKYIDCQTCARDSFDPQRLFGALANRGCADLPAAAARFERIGH
jgi:hypothetical protein